MTLLLSCYYLLIFFLPTNCKLGNEDQKRLFKKSTVKLKTQRKKSKNRPQVDYAVIPDICDASTHSKFNFNFILQCSDEFILHKQNI